MGDVVGLVEKAQSVISEKDAEAAARKLQKGQFNFEDFLAQLNMIKKLGPLKKVLGMLPGVGAAMKDVDFDDKHMKRLEAMILSMTPRERQRPEIMDLPRRRRIAQGSGNDLDAVNGLIKQFKAMQDMMKKLGKGGGLPPGMDGLLGGGGLGGLGGPGGGRPGGGFPGLGGGGGGFPGLGGGRGFPGLPGGRRR
jgi:signal recognition particle subunit SRP54